MMENIDQRIAKLQEINQEVIQNFGNLSEEMLHAKPGAKNWSIAENLSHLIKVNSSYFPIFKKLKTGTFRGAFIGKINLFPKLIGDAIYKSVSDGGVKKVKTFPLWEPSASENTGDIISDFQKHQKELMEWMHQMEPFVEKKVIIHSPVNRLIVYSLDRALDIIISHEKRHIDQAKRVLEAVNSK